MTSAARISARREPEAPVRGRRPPREHHRARGDAERDDVREVVPGVREQREAAGEERRDHLDSVYAALRASAIVSERRSAAAVVVMVVAVLVNVRRAHDETVPQLTGGHRRCSGRMAAWPASCSTSTVSSTSPGEPIPGAVEAVARLRGHGHSLRFVTNNSTMPRPTLAEELRGLGFELDDDELQTTPARGGQRARRQARARARDGRDRARPRGDRARRRPRRRRAARRLRRDDRAQPGVLVDEPRPRLRGAPDGCRPLLPAQEQVVADEPRPAARRRRLRCRSRVRDRRRRDRAREAERRRTSPPRSTPSTPSPS